MTTSNDGAGGQRVLVVDDEPKMQRVLEIMLQRMGYDVVCASTGSAALDLIKTAAVDLVISDVRMPNMSGIELLQHLREDGNEVPVIMMTAFGSITSAVEAMRLGACDYMERPFDVDSLERTIQRILNAQQLRMQNAYLRQEVEKSWGEFIGHSPMMQQVYAYIRQVASGKTTVLITGETGTGKELVARAIHRASPRHAALFVPINCAAIPADLLESELFGYEQGAFTGAHKAKIGKFELADGGTLFLDEIAEMPMPLQAKLLRVLQENKVERLGSNRSVSIDVRIVAATNQNPRLAIAEGNLREDLYYRINVFHVELPALRERPEDIPVLVQHFLTDHKPGISIDAMQCLQCYAWPGNVRELKNVMERAVVLSPQKMIGIHDLPLEIIHPEIESRPTDNTQTPANAALNATDLDLNHALESLEQSLIQMALTQTDHNKSKAARALNISERTLWYKLKKYQNITDNEPSN